MNRVTNPLLMVLPEEAMGTVLVLMIVGGGLLIVIGARKLGGTLVGLGIAMPFISVVIEALMNEFFFALPDDLIQPVAYLIMAVVYAALGYALLKLVLGQEAVDQAKGQLLADAIKGLLRLMFRWPVMLLWVPALAYMTWVSQ